MLVMLEWLMEEISRSMCFWKQQQTNINNTITGVLRCAAEKLKRVVWKTHKRPTELCCCCCYWIIPKGRWVFLPPFTKDTAIRHDGWRFNKIGTKWGGKISNICPCIHTRISMGVIIIGHFFLTKTAKSTKEAFQWRWDSAKSAKGGCSHL